MKKRILAICLTLVMLLCALPFAAAAEDTTTTAYLVLTDHLLNDMHIKQDGCTKLAVGDTIRVTYDGSMPADVIINGQTVQQGCTADMLYRVDEIISYISRYFTLKTGDILYTGTPAGVGPIHADDHLEGYLEDQKVLEFNVK